MRMLKETVLGVAGYVLDLFRVATFRFLAAHTLTKFLAINRLRRRTGASVFVETGTFMGETTARAAMVFEKVYTIELGHELAMRAKDRFKNNKNVVLIEGDAIVMLARVFEDYKFDNAIVFLDGHFSEGITACGEVAEPAIIELEFLAKHKQRIGGIVVDDFRTFGVVAGHPTKAQLLASAESLFGSDGYTVSVLMDQLLIYKPLKKVEGLNVLP